MKMYLGDDLDLLDENNFEELLSFLEGRVSCLEDFIFNNDNYNSTSSSETVDNNESVNNSLNSSADSYVPLSDGENTSLKEGLVVALVGTSKPEIPSKYATCRKIKASRLTCNKKQRGRPRTSQKELIIIRDKPVTLNNNSIIFAGGKEQVVIKNILMVRNPQLLLPKPCSRNISETRCPSLSDFDWTEWHLPYSKHTVTIQERLDKVYKLPKPTQESFLDSTVISQEEQQLFPEFFLSQKQSCSSRYLKIRSHIINVWFANKPAYISKTSVRRGLNKCGNVNLISRVHAYLEQKGAINFGCDLCHYNLTKRTRKI